MGDNDTFAKLESELRRGVLVLVSMAQLRVPRYGYELRQALAEQGLTIEEGTLYPLLRRLEAQGLLRSEWWVDGGAPRRYYVVTVEGRKLLRRLADSWQGLNEATARLLADGGM